MRFHILYVLFALASISLAATKQNLPPSEILDFKWYQKNQWRITLTNYGTFGYGINRAGGEWPAGSGNMYIYGAGIWIGALRTPTETLVSSGYDPSSGRSEFTPGCWENATTPGNYARNFERVYVSPEDWPPYRDSFPVSMRDSVRTFLRIPQPSGDTVSGYFYPVPQRLVSTGDAWTVFNDRDTTRHVGGKKPVGIEVYQNIYSWNFSRMSNIIFLSLTVKNKTNSEIHDMYLGMVCDPDIGNATDDMSGLILRKFVRNRTGTDSVFVDNIGYTWDSDFDEGWQTPPGYVGFDFLQSPYAYTDGIDNDHDGVTDEGPDGIDNNNNGLIDEPAEIEQLGMVSYKIFTLAAGDPRDDFAQYMAMTGHAWRPPYEYIPYDSIDPAPADKRFLQATGPFNLKPDSLVTLTIAIMASPSNPVGGVGELYQLARTSSMAQSYYNNAFIAPNVIVNYPNGGEYLSGNVPISYQATSSSPSPLLIDLFYSSDWGIHWNNIATGLSNTGSLNWSSLSVPDGVCYLIKVDAYNNATGSSDISDSIFTINNPGNSVPYIKILYPTAMDSLNPDSLSEICSIRWFARDPEFRDSLYIDILFRRIGDTLWIPIALNESNDRIFSWNTRRLPNVDGVLKLRTHDEQFEYYDTVFVRLRNRQSGGSTTHTQGVCNIPNLFIWIHQPESLTNHQYELSFRPPRPHEDWNNKVANYGYNIVDVTTQDTVLREPYFSAYPIQDFSPIVNGFSIEASYGSLPYSFHYDSIRIVTGNYPHDSIGLDSSNTLYFGRWAYRGSHYRLYWTNLPGGGRTLQVYDLDYNIYIPYQNFRNNGNYIDSAYGWCFWRFSSLASSETLRMNYDRYLYICGVMISFRRGQPITVLPESGDVWIVYSCPLRPPVDGNKYLFTPTSGIEDNFIISPQIQVSSPYPNPFVNKMMINYSITKQAIVKLTVFDIAGREVKNLLSGVVNPGRYTITWQGDDNKGKKVSTGIYFIKLDVAGKNIGKKIIRIN
jgi:hypothetical protein